LRQLTGKSREKRISKEYPTIQIFYPLRVTPPVNSVSFTAIDLVSLHLFLSPPSLAPPPSAAVRRRHRPCRRPPDSSRESLTLLSVRGVDTEREALGWLLKPVHPHRHPPEAVQDRSRHCSSASSTPHPSPSSPLSISIPR
jgi:hypothetical protein